MEKELSLRQQAMEMHKRKVKDPPLATPERKIYISQWLLFKMVRGSGGESHAPEHLP
jgi:hypothetical protein